MKKISLIITLVLFSTFSFGSDAEKKERINELMTLTNVSAMVDAAYSQSFQMMQGLKTELGIRPEEEQKFEQFMNRVSREMRTEMSWQKMEGPMTDVYMKNFSLTELQDMVAFYKDRFRSGSDQEDACYYAGLYEGDTKLTAKFSAKN